MKITLFTRNQVRHNYLINFLSNLATELNVVQENTTIFPGTLSGDYPTTDTMKEYFTNVNNAQKKIFGNSFVSGKNKNIKLLPLKYGDLKKCSIKFLSEFLKSDFYIVFGSSYIKNDLVEFLINNKALNIHMGVSPYYRGRDCNFWALYDNNSYLVGSTIHLLSKRLDGGAILYHALSEKISDPFLYTMSTVKSAFISLTNKIKDRSIFQIKNNMQDKSKEIRYSKTTEFTDEVIKEFMQRKIDTTKEFDLSLLKEPYFLKKSNFY